MKFDKGLNKAQLREKGRGRVRARTRARVESECMGEGT